MIYQKQISLRTTGQRDMHDLTQEVAEAVANSGVQAGLVHLFNVGSTGAVGTISRVCWKLQRFHGGPSHSCGGTRHSAGTGLPCMIGRCGSEFR